MKILKIQTKTPKDLKRKHSLMQTIKLPKNLKNLGDRLPRSQYNTIAITEAGRQLTAKYNVT
jgi:hypothetical protein